jgi:hypothetical protein
MTIKHLLLSIPGTDALGRKLDRYCNLHFARADRTSPSYRLLYVLGDESRLARVAAALDADAAGTPTNPADEARDLGQLNLLVSLLGLRNGALAERLRDEGNARLAHSGGDPAVPAPLRTRLDADPRYQIADLTATLAETRRELLATRANLAAANDLLARIGRGRVMRVLNALGSIAGRG